MEQIESSGVICFPNIKDVELRGVCLSGSRLKEGITQKELSELAGIPESHISEMKTVDDKLGKSGLRYWQKL